MRYERRGSRRRPSPRYGRDAHARARRDAAAPPSKEVRALGLVRAPAGAWSATASASDETGRRAARARAGVARRDDRVRGADKSLAKYGNIAHVCEYASASRYTSLFGSRRRRGRTRGRRRESLRRVSSSKPSSETTTENSNVAALAAHLTRLTMSRASRLDRQPVPTSADVPVKSRWPPSRPPPRRRRFPRRRLVLFAARSSPAGARRGGEGW